MADADPPGQSFDPLPVLDILVVMEIAPWCLTSPPAARGGAVWHAAYCRALINRATNHDASATLINLERSADVGARHWIAGPAHRERRHGSARSPSLSSKYS